MTPPPVLYGVAERIATITLNRPEVRNALNPEALELLGESIERAEHDPDVDVLVLTGADPAFCAGLDLQQLSSNSNELLAAGTSVSSRDARGPFGTISKPLVGAVNGPAVTGGFELALNCDFLVASERAKFGDTHTRVGVMPSWGLSVLLPQAIGIRRAREMSFTGNFMGAAEALARGLVNHVVPHDELMPFTRRIATDIVGNDQQAVRQLRHTYATVTHDDDAWETESRDARAWQRTAFDARRVGARRAEIERRGRDQ